VAGGGAAGARVAVVPGTRAGVGGCNEPSRLGSSLRCTELCSNHGDTRPRRPSHPRD